MRSLDDFDVTEKFIYFLLKIHHQPQHHHKQRI